MVTLLFSLPHWLLVLLLSPHLWEVCAKRQGSEGLEMTFPPSPVMDLPTPMHQQEPTHQPTPTPENIKSDNMIETDEPWDKLVAAINRILSQVLEPYLAPYLKFTRGLPPFLQGIVDPIVSYVNTPNFATVARRLIVIFTVALFLAPVLHTVVPWIVRMVKETLQYKSVDDSAEYDSALHDLEEDLAHRERRQSPYDEDLTHDITDITLAVLRLVLEYLEQDFAPSDIAF